MVIKKEDYTLIKRNLRGRNTLNSPILELSRWLSGVQESESSWMRSTQSGRTSGGKM
jgi:hypothetical protein